MLATFYTLSFTDDIHRPGDLPASRLGEIDVSNVNSGSLDWNRFRAKFSFVKIDVSNKVNVLDNGL